MYDALGGSEALMGGRRVDAAYKAAAIDDIAEMVPEWGMDGCLRAGG